MKEDREIKITDISTLEGDNEPEAIEVTTRGTLNGTENDYTLIFDEFFGDGMKSHTVLTAKNKNCVSIVRTGDVITELQLEQGKRHICLYSTPYGDMNIGIYTKEIESLITEKGGTLSLNYTVDFNGALSSTKQMLIEVN